MKRPGFIIIAFAIALFCYLSNTAECSAKEITVKGNVLYSYKQSAKSDNVTAPLTNFKIEIYDKHFRDGLGDDRIKTVNTDANGNFNFTMNWYQGLDLFFKVQAEDESARVVKGDDSALHQYNSEIKLQIKDGDTVDFGTVTISGETGAALRLVKIIRTAYNWFPEKPPMVTVHWRKGYTKGTHYNTSDSEIYVLGSNDKGGPDECDTGVILHEYGHYIMAKLAASPPNAGGHHTARHFQNAQLGYSEGWAHYLSSVIRGDSTIIDSDKSSDGEFTRINIETPDPDPFFTAISATPIAYTSEDPTGATAPKMITGTPSGAENEMENAAVLWDLTDKQNETYSKNYGIDNLNFPMSDILTIFRSNVATSSTNFCQTIQDFWNNWLTIGKGKSKPYETWQIFNRHGMQFDNQPPTIKFEPLNYKITSVTEAKAVAADNIKVDQVKFFLDGKLAKTAKAAPYTFPIIPSEMKAGKHVLKAVAWDPAGSQKQAILKSTTPADANSNTSTAAQEKVATGSEGYLTNNLTDFIGNLFGVDSVAFETVGEGDGVSLATTTPEWDDIGQILSLMGKDYKVIDDASLVNYDNIKNYDVLFLNCNSYAYEYASEAAQALQTYVDQGGSIYASDFASDYIRTAFPEAINFSDYYGDAQSVNLSVLDKGMADYLGSDNLTINYDLGGWVIIDSVGPGTTVHASGNVYNYDYEYLPLIKSDNTKGKVHEKKANNNTITQASTSTTNQGTLMGNKPLIVSFRYGNGKVVFTTFHNEAQISDMEKKLLEYLVLSTEDVDAQNNILESLPLIGFNVEKIFLTNLNPGVWSNTYKFICEDGYDFNLMVDSSQGLFDIQIFKPDGTLYNPSSLHEVTQEDNAVLNLDETNTFSNPSPPFGLTIENPEAGEWSYRIYAKDVHFANTPVVLGVGTRLRSPVVNDFDSVINSNTTTLKGTAPGASQVILSVNGQPPVSTPVIDGTFIFNTVSLDTGENTLTLVARSQANQESQTSYSTITVDKESPVINISESLPTTVDRDYVNICGSISELGTVLINNEPGELSENLIFNKEISLQPGLNNVEIKATDLAGNTSTYNLQIDCFIPMPDINPPIITNISISDNSIISDELSVTVSAVDESPFTIEAYLDDALLEMAGTNEFLINPLDFEDGKHEFNVKATDSFENTGRQTISVIIDNDGTTLNGDINNDGVTDIQDVMIAVNIALNRYNPTSEEFNAADVYKDGAIDIQDVMTIVNIALGRV